MKRIMALALCLLLVLPCLLIPAFAAESKPYYFSEEVDGFGKGMSGLLPDGIYEVRVMSPEEGGTWETLLPSVNVVFSPSEDFPEFSRLFICTQSDLTLYLAHYEPSHGPFTVIPLLLDGEDVVLDELSFAFIPLEAHRTLSFDGTPMLPYELPAGVYDVWIEYTDGRESELAFDNLNVEFKSVESDEIYGSFASLDHSPRYSMSILWGRAPDEGLPELTFVGLEYARPGENPDDPYSLEVDMTGMEIVFYPADHGEEPEPSPPSEPSSPSESPLSPVRESMTSVLEWVGTVATSLLSGELNPLLLLLAIPIAISLIFLAIKAIKMVFNF